MSLLQSIQGAQVQARKSKTSQDDAIRVSLLTTLLGEAATVGKNAGNRETSDAECVAVVKKFLKNIEDTRAALQGKEGAQEALHKLDVEVQVLEAFLPAQLDEAQLRATLVGLAKELGAATPKDMGRLMKALKERFDGQYDGKLASTLCKDVLAG